MMRLATTTVTFVWFWPSLVEAETPVSSHALTAGRFTALADQAFLTSSVTSGTPYTQYSGRLSADPEPPVPASP